MPLTKGARIKKSRIKTITKTNIMWGGWPFGRKSKAAPAPAPAPAPTPAPATAATSENKSNNKINWTPEELAFFEAIKQQRQKINELRNQRNAEITQKFFELIMIIQSSEHFPDGTIYIEQDEAIEINEIINEANLINDEFNLSKKSIESGSA